MFKKTERGCTYVIESWRECIGQNKEIQGEQILLLTFFLYFLQPDFFVPVLTPDQLYKRHKDLTKVPDK